MAIFFFNQDAFSKAHHFGALQPFIFGGVADEILPCYVGMIS